MLSAKSRLVRCDRALSSTSPLHEMKHPGDPAICSKCQAVWHKGKWSLHPLTPPEIQRRAIPIVILCPACKSDKEGNPTGILYLTGPFLAKNRAEILNLLHSAARIAAIKNPLERIIRINVNKACGGTLDIRFSHVDKLVRVYWQREAVGSET
jgi:hypothetical protein